MNTYGIVRFTKDLELNTAGDTEIVKTNIAWNDKRNNGHFHQVVFWGKNAINVSKFFSKGDKIFIKHGTLTNNNYTNKEGQTVYQNVITVLEWEFVEQKDRTQQPERYQPSQAQQQVEQEIHGNKVAVDVDSSDLPF